MHLSPPLSSRALIDDHPSSFDQNEAEIAITETEIVINTCGEMRGPAYTRLSDLMREAVAYPKLPIILHLQHATRIDSNSLSLLHTTGQQMILSQRSLTIHVMAETQPCRVLKMSQIDQFLLFLSENSMPKYFTIISHPT